MGKNSSENKPSRRKVARERLSWVKVAAPETVAQRVDSWLEVATPAEVRKAWKPWMGVFPGWAR